MLGEIAIDFSDHKLLSRCQLTVHWGCFLAFFAVLPQAAGDGEKCPSELPTLLGCFLFIGALRRHEVEHCGRPPLDDVVVLYDEVLASLVLGTNNSVPAQSVALTKMKRGCHLAE